MDRSLTLTTTINGGYKTRIYIFNKKSKVAKVFYELVKLYYDGLSVFDREKIFSERRRPRKPGKPVIKKGRS
jgi:hypothetical protein